MKRINLIIIALCAIVFTMLFASCQKANELQANINELAKNKPYYNMAKIEWIAYTEVNVSHYTVQMSTDAISWLDKGMVMAQDSSVHKYSININTLGLLISTPGKYYTRIRATDLDGTISYSPVMTTNVLK